jgi:hypothetical protein
VALSAGSGIQINGGYANAVNPVAATLPDPVADGSGVLIFVTTNSPLQGGIGNPPGAEMDANAATSGLNSYVFRKIDNVAGETSWAVSNDDLGVVCWVAWEVAELGHDSVDVPAVIAVTSVLADGTSYPSAGDSATTTVPDTLCVAMHATRDSNLTAPTWSGHTAGFVEVKDQGTSGTATSLGISVSRLAPEATGTFRCAAAPDRASNGSGAASYILMIYRAGAKVTPDTAGVLVG